MLDALTGFAVVGLAIVVGYVLGRTGLLGAHARYVLSRLTFFVLSPFLLFVVLARADVATLFSALLPVSAIAAVLTMAVSVAVSLFVLRRGAGETVIAALSAGQVNANNIGIPISLYLLGNAAYSAPVILFQLLVLMPIALAILDASTTGTRSLGRLLRQTARNPMLIGSLLGLVVALTGIELPPIALDPILLIANACVPVMLLSYGISLYGQRVLGTSGRTADVLVASALKLVVMPAIAWVVGLTFAIPSSHLLIIVILAALPTAQNVFNFAQRYDTGELIARDTILITTIGCIPVLLAATVLLGPPP